MITAIAAVDEKMGIGLDGKMPWHIPEELKKFKEVTLNGIVIMGRVTYESIGRPLPERINIVITKNLNYNAPHGIILCSSIEEALKISKNYMNEIFIIGGNSIYQQFFEKNLIDKLCISFVRGDYQADTFFPNVNFEDYKITKEEVHNKFVYKEFFRVR